MVLGFQDQEEVLNAGWQGDGTQEDLQRRLSSSRSPSSSSSSHGHSYGACKGTSTGRSLRRGDAVDKFRVIGCLPVTSSQELRSVHSKIIERTVLAKTKII